MQIELRQRAEQYYATPTTAPLPLTSLEAFELIKTFLLSLPQPVIPFSLFDAFIVRHARRTARPHAHRM
jgi:hypothetical protein